MSRGQGGQFSHEDGARAVELARTAVESYVHNGQREQPGSMREAFYERTGAFVRLESHGRLRGCAGALEADRQLGHGVVDAAIGAATEGSCRTEVAAAELPDLTVSVCVVSELLLTDDPLADLEVGVHGVAVDSGGEHCWLFPALPAEQGWSAREYIERTCRTAGLAADAWEREETMVTLFEGRLFEERSPGGDVEALN
jgi:uncharacterized protein (TIGR00296 family)